MGNFIFHFPCELPCPNPRRNGSNFAPNLLDEELLYSAETFAQIGGNPPKQPSLFQGRAVTLITAVTIVKPHCQSICKIWSDGSDGYFYPQLAAVTAVTFAVVFQNDKPLSARTFYLKGHPKAFQLYAVLNKILSDLV